MGQWSDSYELECMTPGIYYWTADYLFIIFQDANVHVESTNMITFPVALRTALLCKALAMGMAVKHAL